MDARHTKLAVEIDLALEHIKRVQKSRGFSISELISHTKPRKYYIDKDGIYRFADDPQPENVGQS